MDNKKKPDESTAAATEKPQPRSAPATDPTNPHNQEPVGDWVANERAAERRNIEPGLTDADRQQRR